jgi:hypothetical protein
MKNLEKSVAFGVFGNLAKDKEVEVNDDYSRLKPDFENPKGIYPIYVNPSKNKQPSFLNQFPFATRKLRIPSLYDNIQIEASLLLECEIKYHNDAVLYINPKRFTAFNNASIYRLTTHKISHNKNWGQDSKGVANKWVKIDRFSEGGNLDNYRIVSFVKKQGSFFQYTEDTQIISYSYFYDNLLDWLLKQLNGQKESNNFEGAKELLTEADHPEKLLISVGETEQTQFGQTNFLQDRDEIFVVLYDHRRYRAESIKAYLLAYGTRNVDYDGMVILHQRVYTN